MKYIQPIVFILAIQATSIASALPKDDSPVMQRIKSRFEGNLGIARQEQMYEFDTPAAHSILTYDKMTNMQYHLGIKAKHFLDEGSLDHIFGYADFNFGQTKHGEVRDDDVRNGAGAMSYHNLSANNNKYEAGVGFTTDLSKIHPKFNSHLLSFSIGLFNRSINASSNRYGSYAYVNDGLVAASQAQSRDQVSRANFYGLSYGIKMEKIIDQDSSIAMSVNLLSANYKSRNYWVERNIDWKLESESAPGINGIALKPEYTTNLTQHVDLNIFAYYEYIKVRNLRETTISYPDAPNEVGVAQNIVPGYAVAKTQGIGVALKFW